MRRKQLAALKDEVVKCATEYITEVECPAPDLAYRVHLKTRLADAVHALEEATRDR